MCPGADARIEIIQMKVEIIPVAFAHQPTIMRYPGKSCCSEQLMQKWSVRCLAHCKRDCHAVDNSDQFALRHYIGIGRENDHISAVYTQLRCPRVSFGFVPSVFEFALIKRSEMWQPV